MTTRSSGAPGGRALARSAAGTGPGAPLPFARPRERLGQPLVRERLEQVVDRVHLERPQRELVVRRDEDHRHVAAHQLEHLEAVELRHLHVEQQDVGARVAQRLDRLESVRALRQHDDVAHRLERLPQRQPRRLLVVDDHDVQHVRWIAHAAASSIGIVTDTR